MQLLGFAKFITNFCLRHEPDIADRRRPGLPIPVTTKLLAAYVLFLLAADRPGRDCQFQLAPGCLADSGASLSVPAGSWLTGRSALPLVD